jgi:hypothetical protein
MANRDQWSWRSYVYGLLTPMAVGVGATVLTMILVLVTGRPAVGDGKE